MPKKQPPYIKGKAEIIDENGKVIGYETIAYFNPKFKLFPLPKTNGNNKTDSCLK